MSERTILHLSSEAPKDAQIDDATKEKIKVITELHKQNADFIKTIMGGLTALLAVFGVAAAAVFSAGNQSVLPGSGLSSSALPQPTIAPLFTPYTIFGLLIFQNLLLREIRRKAGNQQYLEETLNGLIGSKYAHWERDVGIQKFSACNFGYQAFGWMVLIISLENGVKPYILSWICRNKIDLTSFLQSPFLHLDDFPGSFVIPHALLLLLLVFSTIEVMQAKSRAYHDSIGMGRELL